MVGVLLAVLREERRDGGKLSAGVDVTQCKIVTNFVLNNIEDLIRG